MKVVIGLVEHLADIVACEPVARYLKLTHPGCTLSWVVKAAYRDLVDSNPHIDETVAVDCLTDWIKISRHGTYDKVIDLHLNYRGCSHCGIPLIKTKGDPFINAYEWFDHGALLEALTIGAGLPKLSAPPRLYLNESHSRAVDTLGLPEQYCVIHRESDNEKDWTDDNWRGTAEWITRELQLSIVEIGVSKGRASPLNGCARDLLDKTSVLEAAEVIRRARFFVGVDSGPAHLASAVRTPGIVLLGRMGTFRQYMPYTGFYGSEAPDVKLVRNLTGPARGLSLQEVVDNVRYVNNILDERERAADVSSTTQRAGEGVLPACVDGEADARDRRDILASPFFDGAWYTIQYPEIEGSACSPVDHYLLVGAARGYAPGPEFDGAAYFRDHRDVASSGANPLLHYIRFGEREGRSLRSLTSGAGERRTSAIPSKTPAGGNAPGLSSALGYDGERLHSDEISTGEMPRTFAFYLPQFHPIAENDWAHGRGFTEWNNVVKTKPLFNGHYQPRIPGELGYYDLRAPEIMEEQLRLAVEHGITGFCFYYYYFHGKKLLYKPIDNYVKSNLKAPFFLLWANENWSKRWDGGDKEVIIAQQHSREDDLEFIRGLFPLFEDDRYTKIGGKPLLMIYKAYLFPDMLATVETWREATAKHGFPGLYLVMVDDWTPEPIQPRTLGFDAAYEIPSNVMPPEVLFDDLESLGLQNDFTGRVVDYQKFAQFHMSRPFPEYRRFRTVMLPWDNTPRYGSRAIVHVNTVGEGYKLWLSQAMLDTYSRYPAEERIVLLHSWNEWCEGTYLEPDGRYGRRYLEQTKDAIDDVKTVLTFGGGEKHAKALELLKRIQVRKDEAAFRMLQAAHVKQMALEQEREELLRELSVLKSTAGRMRRKVGKLLGF